MAQSRSTASRLSAEELLKQAEELLGTIEKALTQHPETGRALLPNFQLSKEIGEKVAYALNDIEENMLERAHAGLQSAHKHFTCQQAAYTKNHLVQSVSRAFDLLQKNGTDEDLVGYAKKRVDEFVSFVTTGAFFEIGEAAKRYWTAFDSLQHARTEFAARKAKREAAAAQEARAKEEAAAESARQREAARNEERRNALKTKTRSITERLAALSRA